jgi:hypothetical protein
MKKRETVIHESLSDDQQRKLDRRRWRKDKVQGLAEGFSMVPDGRAASIYFREGERFAEFAAELSGNPEFDLILFEDAAPRWIDVNSLDPRAIPKDERDRILSALRRWFDSRGIRVIPQSDADR